MAEILATIVGLLDATFKIKEHVIDPLKIQFSYLCRSNNILASLRAEIQSLEIVRASLQLDVDAARRNLEIIGPDVEAWLKRVDEIKEETDSILRAIPEIQQGCVNGSCPNLKLRYSISRKAKKMAKAVVEVRDAAKFDRVAHPAPPPRMEIIPVPSGTEFESRKTKEDEIMAALRDDSAYMIGICGMGGVGKTTMANKIGKRASAENLFDAVAMAIVSQQPNPSGIQQHIAEALGLKLEERTISICASKIRTRLMDLKKILIIMDDIWAWLNLEELGIPSQSNHKGCKIILTSRDRHVCTEMKATNIFSLEGLLQKEAWALFKDNAGTCVDDRDLHQIAIDVASECKGLPLALVTVGRGLRDQNTKPVWEDALVQLKKSAPSNIPRVLKDVYQPLGWSYKNLESDEARYFFLLCCLLPEDSQISLKYLLHCGVGLRIFSSIESLRQARNRVDVLVQTLENRNLLMHDGTRPGIRRVKMHDVIRDMAISIASTDKHVFMISHDAVEWPEKDSYESYTCISLILNHDVTLPGCIYCPTLKILRMKFNCGGYTYQGLRYCNWNLAGQVPNTFFDTMRELNVLDIKGIGSLPSSLQSLTNLRTLRLRGSYLKTVSMIGQLVKLEILDLRYSHFTELPKEIGGLEKLRSLDLCGCFGLMEIAPGVISRLVRLEELFVLVSFTNWGAEVEGEGRRNASLEELASLKNLTTLQLHIPDPKVLPLHWPELERSVIWIRRELSWQGVKGEDYGDKNLILDLNETSPLVHAIIRKADRLNLTLGGRGASDELIKSIQERNEHLKSLRLDGCHNMKYLANKLSKENNVFPKLKSLSLSYCKDLEGISSVMSSLAGSFRALEVLKLCGLHKLTHFFWHQKLCLPNLLEVDIKKCSSLQFVFLQSSAESPLQLEEVFKEQGGRSTDVIDPLEFPLTKLSLRELSSFNSFWKAGNGIESSHISDISGSQYLFNQKVTFARIEELTLDGIDTATKIFSSQIPIGSFSRLKLLKVKSCPNLKVIFTPPAHRNFRTLREFMVENCSKLEEVVGEEAEESQAAVKETLFPELKELELSKLPNFKTFCHMKNGIELPQLENILIEDCQAMETFPLGSLSLPSMEKVFGFLDPNLATQFFFNKQVTFASLVALILWNLSTPTKIFSSQNPIGSFSRLELLEVESCSNLKVLFSPPAFRNFRTLHQLRVKNCSKLEEVVGEEAKESQATVMETLFPELKELVLSKLPNFKTFCHMKNGIELPQLESILIEDCRAMETFSLGSLRLPRLLYVFGLSEPDLAAWIFFKKEATRHEIHLENDNFTLSAKDLSGFESDNDYTWCLAKDSDDKFIVVARLPIFPKLRISGRFEMVKLSPRTLYEVAFEIMLEEPRFQLGGLINLELTFSEGITQEHFEDLKQQSRGKWIEVLAGEFTTGPDPIGDLEFTLYKDTDPCRSWSFSFYGDIFDGLLVKGVTIRPKA